MASYPILNFYNKQKSAQPTEHSVSSSIKPLPPLPTESLATDKIVDSQKYKKMVPLMPLSPALTPDELSLLKYRRPSLSELPTVPYSSENWYMTRPSLSPEIMRLFQTYSHIATSEVDDHIEIIRDIAWKISPIPIIGTWDFLVSRINENLHYPAILKRLQKGARFLNLGMGLGVELRRLIADGVRSENLFGCDDQPDFIDLSYRLFQDRAINKSRVFTESILSTSLRFLHKLYGTIDVIYADRLPLQTYEDQVIAAKQMVRLLRGRGSVIIGRQIGHVESGDKNWQPSKNLKLYRHNEASFRKLWHDIGRYIGCKFKVSMAMWPYLATDPQELKAVEAQCGWADPGLRWLSYEVAWGDVGLGDLLDTYGNPGIGKNGMRL